MTRLTIPVLLGLVGLLAGACGAPAPDDLPYYGDRDFTPRWSPSTHVVGDFVLTAQTGDTFTSDQLRGRPYVASFIFTTCRLICPPLVTNVKRVHDATAGTDVMFVSFTVSPDIDTVDVLARYGATRGLDPDRWKLLTGPIDRIERLARESFFADDPRAGDDEVLHSEKVLLVDRDGHLRGVYNGTLAFEMDKLLADLDALDAIERGT